MTRAHNFCAGPAALPAEVLQRVQSELLDWQGMGASVMELSHRSPEFVDVAERAEQALRRLLGINDDYVVRFQQGGASQQFASVPLNLARADDTVDQVVTGQWSKKALAEGKRHVSVNVASTSEDSNFSTIQSEFEWR